ACRPPLGAGVAFARQPDPLSVASTGLDSNLQWLGALHHPFASTRRASGDILTRAVAAWTLHIELHATTGLGDLALAATLRAHAGGLNEAAPMAIATYITTSDVQPHNSTADRLPKTDVDLVLQVV